MVSSGFIPLSNESNTMKCEGFIGLINNSLKILVKVVIKELVNPRISEFEQEQRKQLILATHVLVRTVMIKGQTFGCAL